MDGRLLFAAALGILFAVGSQTALTGIWASLGALRQGPAPRPMRKIGFRAGLRALLGSALPLCAAAWLASSRSRPLPFADGVLVGIAVWGGFMTLMTVSGTAGGASWFGSIMQSFRQGLRRFGAPPPTAHPAPAGGASRAEAEIREAYRARQGGETLKESLRGYLDHLAARSPDRFEIEREANSLFDDEAVREAARRGDLLRVDRNRFRELAASRGDISVEETVQWAEALQSRWSALREEGQGREAVEGVAAVASPGPGRGEAAPTPAGPAKAGNPPVTGEAAQPGATAGPFPTTAEKADKPETATAVAGGFPERLAAFKEFLRGAERSALNPDRLEREVALLVILSEAGHETVDKEARSVRRDDVAQVLRQRRDITSREADSIADLIDSARTRMLSRTEIREHRRQEATDQALARLRDRLYGISRPERDYAAFARAIERLLEERLSASGTAEAELKEWDRPALQAMFFSKQGISQADAERMAEQADTVFRNAQESARRLEAEITRRRDEELLSAEAGEASARSLAVSSARWVAGIACLDAAAAALGGWLGAHP